jgi:hypothetical protein
MLIALTTEISYLLIWNDKEPSLGKKQDEFVWTILKIIKHDWMQVRVFFFKNPDGENWLITLVCSPTLILTHTHALRSYIQKNEAMYISYLFPN